MTPAVPNPGSSVPSERYRTRATSGSRPFDELPATTILPSGWIATFLAKSEYAPRDVVTMPSPPNIGSRDPSGLYRATAKSDFVPLLLDPTTTILPSACKATSQAAELVPIGVVTVPSPPKVGSRDPSALYRATTNTSLVPSPMNPTATIL